MSKQQVAQQDDQAAESAGQETQRSATQPATAMVRELLASRSPDPEAIAAIVAAHPRASHEIFALLHRTAGNRFASMVLNLATSKGAAKQSTLGEPRDVVSFDQSSEYREGRATIDGPPKQDSSGLGEPRDVVSFDSSSEYRESRATIDGPPKATESKKQDDSGLGEPRDVVSFDASSEYRESRATIDRPRETEKPAPAWVTKAQRYNSAHADNVTAFLGLTGTRCVDEATGEADPRKVARWQADHGIPPDGRIGDQTLDAAISSGS